MDYKEETINAYDSYPEEFENKFNDHFYRYVQPIADHFMTMLKGRRVLDLGSGPGNHAAYFKKRGLDVLCIDLSRQMIDACKEKGLDAAIMDIENLALKSRSFNGIWAYTSLLHIPKRKMPAVVEDITSLLKKDSLLGIALKEGEGGEFKESPNYPGTRRWFSYYTDEEVKYLFSSRFRTIYSGKTFVEKDDVFLTYLMMNKSKFRFS